MSNILAKAGKDVKSEPRLADAMSKLEKDEVTQLVGSMLKQGVEPLKIIEGLRKGLETVGNKFEEGEYFLTDLMWSAEIFKAVASTLLPEIKSKVGDAPRKGKLLIGTVEGDIHDVGKNLVAALSECAGFEVIDLGVDVPPRVFVKSVKKHKPQIVGMSGLLTASVESMQKTIQELEKAQLRKSIKIIVGGGAVRESVAEERIKADARAKSAVEGIQKMKRLLRKRLQK